MGRVVTPTFRVEYRTNLLAMNKIASDCLSNVDGRRVLMMAWRRHDGRPTMANLERWRRLWNESFKTVNRHLAPDHINWARLVRQSTGEIMCETTMPTFEVIA
jgi:hypothetical protein